MSSVSSTASTTSRSGVSGLVSGMDTDALVKAALATETAKIEKYKANIQVDEWKTDAYREITSSLQTFYKTYFDSTSSTNMKSANSFASFATSYGTTTSSNYVTMTGNSGAKAGTYTITNLVKATAATLTGSNIAVGGIVDTTQLGANLTSSNNKLSITLNGTTQEVTIAEGATADGLKAALQSSINTAFGEDNILVAYDSNSGTISLSAVDSTDTFSIDSGSSALSVIGLTSTSKLSNKVGLNKVVGGTADISKLSSTIPNILTFTLNGAAGAITIDSSTTEDKLGDVIQKQLDNEFGDGRIQVAYNSGTKAISFSAQNDTDIFSIDKDSPALAVIGLTSTSNLSNKVDVNSNLSDIAGKFSTALDVTGTNGDIVFSINGTSFSFNSSETSIDDIINKVNGSSDIDVKMSYDTTTNSFSIEANDTGAAGQLVIADKTGNLMKSFGLLGVDKGSDASVTVNDGTSTKTIVRSSNSFTYDGMTYDIKQNFKDLDSSTAALDPIVATVSTDTTKTYDFIKGFVDKYNELIDKINEKLTEKRYRDYAPLTNDQKTSMTDDQIKQWETKAKSGLLKNDSILSGIVSNLRSTLYDTVEGAGITLSSIGIATSSDYTTKGKLEIDETKLKEALTNKAEQITKLFTNTSDKTYYECLDSATLKSERYKESGIAQRFSDIIQDAIRTNTDSDGNKGTLLDKAGIVGDRSEYTNLLFKEMEDFDETVTEMNSRLSDKEDALYAKYAAMETALSKLNEQQSNLTQMLGGS